MITLSKDEEKNILLVKKYPKNNQFQKLCVFSHFDPTHSIDNYVVYMLKELYKMKFDIIFVTTSENMCSTQLRKIYRYVTHAVIKKNIGYDFISWKTALFIAKDYTKYDLILHTNDSIFFPLFHPKKMFDTMKYKKVDFWGINDSNLFKHHIQSFFWAFNKKLIRSNFYKKFWNDCTLIPDKYDLVKQYEVELLSLVTKNKFKSGVYAKNSDLLNYANKSFHPHNQYYLKQITPFYIHWDYFIQQLKIPYIKKNMLCSQHKDYNIGTVYYQEAIQSFTQYDKSLISNYLSKIKHKTDNSKESLFYKDLSLFLSLLYKVESNDTNTKILLYGYSQVGKFIHSVLKNHTFEIVDTNSTTINDLQQRYGCTTYANHIDKLSEISYDKVIISALGREKEIKKILVKNSLTTNNIIPIGEELNNSKSFSNNITNLTRLLRSTYLANIKKDIEVLFYNTHPDIVHICNNYMTLHNLKQLNSINNQIIQTMKISFLVRSKSLNKESVINFHVMY